MYTGSASSGINQNYIYIAVNVDNHNGRNSYSYIYLETSSAGHVAFSQERLTYLYTRFEK